MDPSTTQETCQAPTTSLDCEGNEKELRRWASKVDRGYAWVVVVALWVVSLATLGCLRIYGLIFAHLSRLGIYSREQASEPVALIQPVGFFLGPLASSMTERISARWTMLVGAVLVTAANGLASLSRSIYLDVLLIGITQGSGHALLFTPLMSVVNSYFIKYRNMALGFALSGGTVAVFILEPLVQWSLATFPWRYSYICICLVSSLGIVATILLKPNHKPESRLASTTDNQVGHICEAKQQSSLSDEMLFIIKTPAFHLIWFNKLIHYWIFCFSLIVIDYGHDKGCSKLEAEDLLNFQSIGELTGRLVLTALVDAGLFPSLRYTTIITHLVGAALFLTITQVSGYIWMASMSVAIMAMSSFAFVLINPLLVDHLGDQRVTTAYGLGSLICGFLLSARPQVIGYFRDHLETYEPFMLCLSVSCAISAIVWTFEPRLTQLAGRMKSRGVQSRNHEVIGSE